MRCGFCRKSTTCRSVNLTLRMNVMNIRGRLSLSARVGKITLSREGMFLRCYQQSLFSLLRLQQKVKVLGRPFKNLEGRWVFYAGFPATSIMQRLPEAKEMPWGFEVDCDTVSAGDYQDWLLTMILDFEGRGGLRRSWGFDGNNVSDAADVT